jgi:hypothetical protein
MEAIGSSETSVATQQTTRRHIPKDDTLHNHRCENLKSYIKTHRFPNRQSGTWDVWRESVSYVTASAQCSLLLIGQVFSEIGAQRVSSRVEWCQETEKRKRKNPRRTVTWCSCGRGLPFLTTFHSRHQLSSVHIKWSYIFVYILSIYYVYSFV